MIKVVHIKPRKELIKYIRKISLFRSKNNINYLQKLTPSAYTYLSYNHSDIPFSIFGIHKIKPTQRLQIAGPKTNGDNYVEYNGSLHQILIEFTASGFYSLFNLSPSTISNNLLDLSQRIPSEITVKLEKDLLDLDTVEEQVRLLEEFLHERSFQALPIIDYVERALQVIEQNHGSIHINDLIKDIGISERQFNRKFIEVVGISPKFFSKTMQLHYVINLMHLKNYSSMQELAYEAEFYDHAHFNHQFKELTGFTPHEFIHSNKHIALKYFTDLT